MKLLNWLSVGLLAVAVSVTATTPNEPADPKLRSIYQRIHFSQEYPPEAVQFIQAKLQDAEKPGAVFGDLTGDHRPEVRILVALLIGEYGEAEGGKILWKLMRDDSEPVRIGVAAAIIRLAHLTSFPASTEPLQDERPEVRRFAAATLASLADKTAEAGLIEALKDENEFVRMEASRALASCGTENALPSLISRMQDRSVLVRQEVAHTLGAIPSPDAVEVLVRALKDPDWHVRASIITSLGGYAKDPTTRGQVTEPLVRHLQSDDYALVRDRAADALASFADEKVVEALVHALVADERDVRFHAAQAIINAKATSALPKLWEHRHDQNPDVRERIIMIFGKLGGSEQVPAVIEATNDTESQVQLTAVYALRELRERGATANIIPRLKDPNPHVRAAVCRALGDMADKAVCPDLLPLLRDESGYVRSAAAEALGKLGDRSSISPLIQVLSGERPTETKQSDGGLLIGNDKGFLSEFSQLSEVQQKTRAAEALGELRAPEAVDTIVKYGLKGSDPILRAVSAYSLGKIQDGRAVEPLQEAVRPYYASAPTDLEYVIDPGDPKVSDEARRMKEKEARVRASVAWALGQIGDPASRDTLLKAVNDNNSLVRDAAVEALAKIAEREERQSADAAKHK